MTEMIGRIVFLSAAAYAGYWYVRRSTMRAAKEIEKPQGTVEILAPETAGDSARVISSAASEAAVPQLRSTANRSQAAEPDPNR
jgi:hypothetical protein